MQNTNVSQATAWYRWTPPKTDKQTKVTYPGFWSYNHMTEGYVQAKTTPDDPYGRAWDKAEWRGVRATLSGAKGAVQALDLLGPKPSPLRGGDDD